MRNFFTVLLLFLLLTFSGCDREKPLIFFSSKPITSNLDFNNPEVVFAPSTRINFVVYNPKGFKSKKIRLQVIKMSDKVPILGYTLEHARDIEINPSQNYFISDFYIHNTGCFMLRVFGHDYFEEPIVERMFWVK